MRITKRLIAVVTQYVNMAVTMAFAWLQMSATVIRDGEDTLVLHIVLQALGESTVLRNVTVTDMVLVTRFLGFVSAYQVGLEANVNRHVLRELMEQIASQCVDVKMEPHVIQ